MTELHGNIFATKCTNCDFRGKIRSEFSDLPPSCKICGSYLRPHVVRFGEGIKQEVWKGAVMHSVAYYYKYGYKRCTDCEIFIKWDGPRCPVAGNS